MFDVTIDYNDGSKPSTRRFSSYVMLEGYLEQVPDLLSFPPHQKVTIEISVVPKPQPVLTGLIFSDSEGSHA